MGWKTTPRKAIIMPVHIKGILKIVKIIEE
jgi:hypothetical protein